LLGLGFGDCGKGLFTDALCRRWSAHTVVRFNGGAQAGHNVVLPDGRHHTFAQFAAGTLVPGVATVLAYPVVVHPAALLVEYARLRTLGVEDALERLKIDHRCRINTPFHQAAGRLRELQRGTQAHGTCGVGVGETVRHALCFPDHVLRYGDLARPALAMKRLDLIRRDLLAEFSAMAEKPAKQGLARLEYQILSDEGAAERWLSAVVALLRQVPPASPAHIAEYLNRPGCVLFEGAQGVLLDEWRGFHPHTTWSSIHPEAVEAVAAEYGFTARVEHLGVLRSFLTRHGEGPFPTCDSALGLLSEPHNTNDAWQGQFRRGHPDALLLRYALSVLGPLDGLLLSHLDVFDRVSALQWCDAYQAAPIGDEENLLHRDAARPDLVTELLPGALGNLAHQAALTRLLSLAAPKYGVELITSSPSLLERVVALAKCPVWFGAYGPTYETVRSVAASP